MASTTFVNGVTLTDADWFNDVNRVVYTIFGDPANITAIKALVGPTAGTAVASTSGVSISFTSIPSWVKRISLNFSGVSTNGTSNIYIQIGDSGGLESTGYLGAVTNFSGADGVNPTTAFGLASNTTAATVFHGRAVLELLDSATNTWTETGLLGFSSGAGGWHSGGSKSLSGTLDRVTVFTENGTDVFDAGLINILYE